MFEDLFSNGLRKYWRQIAERKWAFATKDNSFRLLEHQELAGRTRMRPVPSLREGQVLRTAQQLCESKRR